MMKGFRKISEQVGDIEMDILFFAFWLKKDLPTGRQVEMDSLRIKFGAGPTAAG
jgi:hypothetical protein